jgi:hypothetical protein
MSIKTDRAPHKNILKSQKDDPSTLESKLNGNDSVNESIAKPSEDIKRCCKKIKFKWVC